MKSKIVLWYSSKKVVVFLKSFFIFKVTMVKSFNSYYTSLPRLLAHRWEATLQIQTYPNRGVWLVSRNAEMEAQNCPRETCGLSTATRKWKY